MPIPLGVGIVSYNRKAILSETIDRVRAFTRQSDAALVVADDGSTDDTLAMLSDKQVASVTGINMGIAWNKNRALFLLSHVLGCETVILLEDDTQPNSVGWEAEWMAAARRWGHVNYAGAWMQEYFISGSGSVADPVRSRFITAQCAAYSSTALTYGGYFDPRFKGYGHEHVEHSRRLVRVGYGGSEERLNNQDVVTYNLLNSDLTVVYTPSFRDAEQEEVNLRLARQIMGVQGYRAPWSNDTEMRQFRLEIDRAMRDGAGRFGLAGTNRRPSPVSARLYERTKA